MASYNFKGFSATRAVASQGDAKLPSDEIRPLAFRIVIKIELETKINRHHAFVAVCFRILK